MQFEYTVLDVKNKKNIGVIEANNFQEAKSILREKNFFIVKLKEKKKFFNVATLLAKTKGNKLNFSSLVDFTRQMGIMINAGLTLIDALEIISSQTTDVNQKNVVNRISEYIKSGNNLSTALADMSDSFPDYYVSLIKAGESSGKLDDVFMRLAENLEKAREFRGKVIGALIYPIIIILGIVLVAFVMMTFVLPQLLDLYKNFDIDLPFSTQVIMSLSTFLSKFWPLVIVVVFVLSIFLKILLKKPRYKKLLDMYLIRLPVFGDIIQKSILVDTTRTLSILIKSGVPLLGGLVIIKDTTTNQVYKDSFSQIYNDVEKGRSLGDSLADQGIFPPIFVQMTSVGERTGKLDETLLRLSKYFQMESELAVKAATTLIEPLILVILGFGVGFLVISVLTPIYNLTSSIGS